MIVALKRQKDDAQAAKSLIETQLEGATLERDIAQQEGDRLRKIVSAGSLPHEGTDMVHMESLKWILVSQIDIVDMLHVIGTYISEGAEEQLLELAMLNKERIQQAGERSGIDRKEVMPEEHLHSFVPIRPQEMEPAKQRDTEERER